MYQLTTRRRRRRALVAASALPGLVGITAAATGSPITAAGPEGSYVVVMAAEPAAAYQGDDPGLAATTPAPGETLDPTDPAVVGYVEHIEAEQEAVLDDAGVDEADRGDSYTLALNGFEAELTDAEVAAIERRPEVAFVVPNELRQLTTDNSGSFLGLDAKRGAWQSGYLGEDVVIGVIDSGIWPEHPSFADDGSYDPLDGYAGLPCEFGDTAHNADDAPFVCNDKLLGAYDMRIAYKQFVGPEVYNSARDYDGHGSHTAATAAGNAGVEASMFGIDRGTVSGVAPRARIIAYSACGDLGCFTSDLVGAIDQAVADGVQVINYSIGGGASLTDPADLAFLFAADANVWTATSNGNNGPGAATVGGPASVPWVTSVGASTQDRTFSSTIRLGDGTLAIGASVTAGTSGALPLVDAADLGNQLCDPAVAFTGDITGKVVLCQRGVTARVEKSRAVAEQGGAGMILANTDDAQALVTDTHFVPSAHVNATTGQAIAAYIDAAGAGATAQLTAGQRVDAQGSVMADFSSRGENPVAPDIIKPDVTAPGVNVLAAHTPTPVFGAPGQLFQSISGTSMSSPHVAGLFALLRQAHPDWTAAQAKSAIMTTARQDVTKEDAVTPADPFDMGAGHVDPAKRVDKPGSMFDPGLVYDAQLFDYFGFLCDAEPAIFVDPEGTCSTLDASGYPIEATNLNLASIGASSVAGSTTVQRTVTSVASKTVTFTPRVEAPPGFDVVVTPKRLRLAPGESATYEVTLTNVGSPVDTWQFGSLTWKGAGYEVRSPIAVKGSLFDAPASVEGTGTDGSVTFPVQFGYEGAYAAAPHGPVAATRTPGTVGQDPDQTFDPADPTGTTAVPITTAGSAFLRIELETADLTPANPDIDIDLFLYDSGGQQVAASTAGGTAESIELTLPADGTYTLYVHGWQTLGADVGFELRSWDVPATPGTGALTVSEAPTSATLGQVADITATWAGLDAGEEYLGAVSHSDGAGLIGLTLVDITT
jgi:subtilisin family serine protease